MGAGRLALSLDAPGPDPSRACDGLSMAGLQPKLSRSSTRWSREVCFSLTDPELICGGYDLFGRGRGDCPETDCAETGGRRMRFRLAAIGIVGLVGATCFTWAGGAGAAVFGQAAAVVSGHAVGVPGVDAAVSVRRAASLSANPTVMYPPNALCTKYGYSFANSTTVTGTSFPKSKEFTVVYNHKKGTTATGTTTSAGGFTATSRTSLPARW